MSGLLQKLQNKVASGIKKKARKNKALVDQVSATIILQNYLDYKV